MEPAQQDITDRRLTDLEIKASYAEDLLDTLNQTVFRQQQQIELLMSEMVQLRKQQSAAAGPGMAAGSRDELPPHY